ncbi:MAG: hypothetical protein JOY64_27860 [Alphaproteobacteria bacterium]|nr:hypothetical protein [Alphaproteobacteria bacterium]MBV8411475.1 hypothetical protein [Alphaproteobacteria bacterium]
MDLIVEEANALGTAWLRADLLPEPSRGDLKDALRQYTANRNVLHGSDIDSVSAGLAKAPELQARI